MAAGKVNFVTSKYIQLADWCLIEYEFSSMNLDGHNQIKTSGSSDAVGIFRVTNNVTKEFQFTNFSYPQGDVRNLGNQLTWNLIPSNVTQSRWATSNIIDSEVFNPKQIFNLKNGDPIPITPNYVLDDLSDTILYNGMHAIRYDKIRIHILSGYNLDGIDGFILDVSFLENSGKKMKASTAAYLRNNTFQRPTFNPNPILMGERMYDKYVTIYVPSLYHIQEEFQSVENPYAFSRLYSHPKVSENPHPGGFLRDSTIYFTLYEIIGDEIQNQVEFFNVRNRWTATILPSDTYSLLSCVIQESSRGDFFEYFPTWQGEFFEDHFQLLNNNFGNVWSVIHNLKVVEQIGSQFFTTSDLTIPQSSDFTKPSYFRPIVVRSNEAIAFSVLYTMRLVNTNTGEQVLRTANVSSFTPKQYGLSSKRIQIDQGIQPMKVYNKVVNETLVHTGTPKTANIFTTKYVPQYVERNLVAVNMTNSDTLQSDAIVFGQGKCTIQLSKFDNVFKFVILNVDGTETLPMNLSNMKLFMKFVLDNEQDITIEAIISDEIHPESGEVVFNVMKEDAIRILKIKNDANFYIIAKQDKSTLETVLYSGTWEKAAQKNETDKEKVKSFEMKLAAARQEIADKTIQLDARESELNILLANNEQVRQNLTNEITRYNKIVDDLLAKIAASTPTVVTPTVVKPAVPAIPATPPLVGLPPVVAPNSNNVVISATPVATATLTATPVLSATLTPQASVTTTLTPQASATLTPIITSTAVANPIALVTPASVTIQAIEAAVATAIPVSTSRLTTAIQIK